jgi:hypothetical protein
MIIKVILKKENNVPEIKPRNSININNNSYVEIQRTIKRLFLKH